jgi:hypothetical protein
MRARISGPSVGPVHTTLWSSRGGNSGCGWLLGFLLVAGALGTLAEYWRVVVPVVGVLIVAAVIGLRIYGKHDPSRKASPRSVEAVIAETNARPAGIRAGLRAMSRAGELDCPVGWHWADGDLLERDAESQAKHSDRR